MLEIALIVFCAVGWTEMLVERWFALRERRSHLLRIEELEAKLMAKTYPEYVMNRSRELQGKRPAEPRQPSMEELKWQDEQRRIGQDAVVGGDKFGE